MNYLYTKESLRTGSRLSYRLSILLLVAGSLLIACQTSKLKAVKDTARTETALLPPKVTQIDAEGLKDLLKPTGKPRLINFWATWCAPCREEFPDLVAIGADHEDKVDLITVSLDDPAEIDREVAKFLGDVQAVSPAYLLKTSDENAAIDIVSKTWGGALPFTILINSDGEHVYSKQGKFDPSRLVAEIGKL